MKKYIKHIGIMFITGILVACGGGGGGGGGVSSSNSINGVAAVGAPIAKALMTLACANGTIKTTTANDLGEFSFTDLTNCTAPYVVKAIGDVGGTQEAYVSVLPNDASGPTTLNVTPITNAIAATLSSNGDPLNLVDNLATEKTQITDPAVTARLTALASSLSGVLTSAGLSNSFNLLQTSFNANGTGFDKVLDNVKVDVKSSGVTITNAGGSVVDDMGNLGSAPATNFSSSTITVNNSTNFSAALPTLPSTILDNSLADIFQTQLNNCFSIPSASRGNIGSLASSCSVVQVASDYLNDGKNAATEFGGRLTNAIYDNAKFGKPEIIRYLSTDPTDTRAIVSMPLLRSDFVAENIQTVVEQSTTTGGVLKLRGNQRPIYIDLSGSVIKTTKIIQRNNTTGARSTYFATGLNVFLDYKIGCSGSGVTGCTGPAANGKVDYVKVTGPFLPASGLFLRNNHSGGCDQYFTIWRNNSTAPNNCTAIFVINSRATSTSDTDNLNSVFGSLANFSDAKVSDDDVLALVSNTAYKFEVFGTLNGCGGGGGSPCPNYTYYQRLRSRPYTIGNVATQSGEVDKIRWNEGLQQTSLDSITPVSGATPATLNSLNVSYVRNLDAAPPFKIFIQTRTANSGSIQSDSLMLPINPNYVADSVISVNLRNSPAGWNNPKTTTNFTDTYNQIELVSRNKFGTILDRMWKY